MQWMASSPPVPRMAAPRIRLVGIDRDLHETQRLAFFDRAADPRHRPLPAQDGPAQSAGLLVGHSDAPERRIDEQAVGDDAVGDAPRFIVQEIGRDNLVIIVGRVGEGAAAVAITERPDSGHVGAQELIGHDIAAGIAAHAGGAKAEIVRVRLAPDREQEMRAGNVGRVPCAMRATISSPRSWASFLRQPGSPWWRWRICTGLMRRRPTC